jgi:hypothetical protein
VHGHDAVEARALSAPDKELLVIEGLRVGLGQRCVDLYTRTLLGRVEAPVAPRATAPLEPEFVPLVFEVWVSGERAVGADVVPDPPVVPVFAAGVFDGAAPVLGTVLVPVGVAGVGVVGLVVVGTPVVVVAGGLPAVVVDVVVVGVVVDGVVVVVGLPAAGSLFRLSGSISSEIGSRRRRVSVVDRAGPLELSASAPAVICKRRSGAGVVAAETGCEAAETTAVAGGLGEPATWAAEERLVLAAGAALTT